MSFPTVTVYGNSDNLQNLRLLDRGEPVNLASVTRILLELDDKTEVDSAISPSTFSWRSPGALGVLRLFLGRDRFWSTKIYYAKLIVYDDLNYSGIFWGNLRIRAIENTVPPA